MYASSDSCIARGDSSVSCSVERDTSSKLEIASSSSKLYYYYYYYLFDVFERFYLYVARNYAGLGQCILRRTVGFLYPYRT
jgi:hypothetical protein